MKRADYTISTSKYLKQTRFPNQVVGPLLIEELLSLSYKSNSLYGQGREYLLSSKDTVKTDDIPLYPG